MSMKNTRDTLRELGFEKKLAPNATCPVCGKKFRTSSDPVFSRLCCSVGCDWTRIDDYDLCVHGYHFELCVLCEDESR